MTKKSLRNVFSGVNESVFPGFHVEADGRGQKLSLLVSGVTGINSFSEKEILISSKREMISITGEILRISLLESKSVRISGRINSLSFNRKKGDKK